ncbi:MAG: hypothetical protein ACP5PR_02590, partial [Minisyncoccia bacterium]
MPLINNKKIYFFILIFIISFSFLNIFTVKAEDLNTNRKYQDAANQVSNYFNKYPELTQPIPSTSTDGYCAENNIKRLRGTNQNTD